MEDPKLSTSRKLPRAGNSMTDIPHDIALEILYKLPAKSLLRFQSVSKLWSNIITSKDFARSFLNRSRTLPRLLITVTEPYCKIFILSVPEHHDEDKSSTVLARHDMTVSDANYPMTISDRNSYRIHSPPVHGFMCCRSGAWIGVCNPTTKQRVKLPDVDLKGIGYHDMYTLLGYDPVEDHYKVLCILTFTRGLFRHQEHLVCTVSSGRKLEWRKIHTTTRETNPFQGISTDGAIYYRVNLTKIARFDVRLETIDFIQAPDGYRVSELVTYQGKLAVASFRESQIRLWILQDAEKQEWSSNMTCDVPPEYSFVCARGSHMKEFIMIPNSINLSCVYYCNMITKSITRVEVDGIDDAYNLGVWCFPGYIENITFL